MRYDTQDTTSPRCSPRKQIVQILDAFLESEKAKKTE